MTEVLRCRPWVWWYHGKAQQPKMVGVTRTPLRRCSFMFQKSHSDLSTTDSKTLISSNYSTIQLPWCFHSATTALLGAARRYLSIPEMPPHQNSCEVSTRSGQFWCERFPSTIFTAEEFTRIGKPDCENCRWNLRKTQNTARLYIIQNHWHPKLIFLLLFENPHIKTLKTQNMECTLGVYSFDVTIFNHRRPPQEGFIEFVKINFQN